MNNIKKCIKCLQDKILSEFHLRNKSLIKYDNTCNTCFLERRRRNRKIRSDRYFGKLRDEIFAFYGNSCQRCFETNSNLLSLCGAEKIIGCLQKRDTYLKLRKLNFPSGPIVLCKRCQVDQISTKICSCCKIFKLLHEFPKCHTAVLKRASYCNQCRKEKLKAKLSNPTNRLLSQKKSRQRVLALKRAAYTKYGGPICACCGENNEQFLTIDHVNNDGNIHRRLDNKSKAIYQWLKTNNYPPDFQVLCFNCNLGKFQNKGICPHKIHEVTNV